MLQRFKGFLVASTLIASSYSVITTPISRSLAVIDSRCFGVMLFTVMQPLVAAAAHIYVPASIWSGIIEYVIPCRYFTPRILITSVPAPLTSAPIELRKFARSTICGSLAAFSMIVIPSALDAASIMFIVAPTETTSR